MTAAWSCSTCTFLNQPRYLACEVCGTERPNPRRSTATPGAAAAAGTAAAAITAAVCEDEPKLLQRSNLQDPQQMPCTHWVCTACTFENEAGGAECDMCGTAAAGAAGQTRGAGAAGAAAAPTPPPLAAAAGQGEVLLRQPPAAAAPRPQPAGAVETGAQLPALPALSGMYTLDCGCRLLAAEVQQHLQQAAAGLPHGLPAIVCHFCCPQKVRSSQAPAACPPCTAGTSMLPVLPITAGLYFDVQHAQGILCVHIEWCGRALSVNACKGHTCLVGPGCLPPKPCTTCAPSSQQHCRKPLTHRDLEALLGAEQANKVGLAICA